MYSSSTDGITHRLYCLFMKSTESFIIRTTDLAGYKADIRSVAIQSFGNAFLLPLDVILGGIFTNDKRQRIFSRAGNTTVMKVKNGDSSQNVRYKRAGLAAFSLLKHRNSIECVI